ncbi:GNAT family N-acetyltransferase [Enterovibrio sp. ZSDZ35]|uniref:GNAT family N-acetyltransferase n=1 Tax=Enterovibrio qingdaonensis TaxID=2899818 RepID=A0ABT5QPC0_9GAMM|nr:GNAT family N-acetyltransferase [Enterovibrio sp. ZSDZ35]MDD1782719.1 GNAT family N-acetyltransferase [Enterovibrio sp. ZSDZ35]
MPTFDTFKQGHAVSLKDGYTIALISDGDLDDIIEMLQNPNVTEYLFFAPAPEDMYRGYFGPIIEGTKVAIANNEWPETITVIIRDNDGKYMGMCGLPSVMFLTGNYEVGFQFAEHAWGRGLASRGCEFLLALAFEELGAHKVTADCYRSNVGSYKTMEKAGLVKEGCQHDYFNTARGKDDRLLYGITKEQYSANKRF